MATRALVRWDSVVVAGPRPGPRQATRHLLLGDGVDDGESSGIERRGSVGGEDGACACLLSTTALAKLFPAKPSLHHLTS